MDKKVEMANQLDALFLAAGWRARGEKWLEILEKTSEIFLEHDDDQLIGCARFLEDGVMCVIFDMVVHPDYRRQGVGTRIMNRIKNKISGKNYIHVGLFATDEAIPFYKALGYAEDNGMRLTLSWLESDR